MKKLLVSTAISLLPAALFAQSAFDAYQLSGTNLAGTARFVSMAGAFTALGGDLSVLGQNPGGIGVYRKSEIGLTLDLGFNNSKTTTPAGSFKNDKTRFSCSNFGYIGTINLGGETMRSISWGVTYNRVAEFNSTYHVGSGYGNNYVGPKINGSLSNYIASFSNGYEPKDLLDDTSSNYNPYYDSSADWLSILAYNSYMINPQANGMPPYQGLWQNGSNGDMGMDVRERGGVDEYNLDFGGNIADIVYWGLGFGITDLNFTQETNYNEQINNARIANAAADNTETGDAYFNLNNYRNVNGTGVNFKLGLILKPINEFRIGLAVHTPTYYSLSQSFTGETNYSYSSGYDNGRTYADYGYFDWRLKTPWKLMFGMAGVIDARYIISADYEMAAYNNMSIKSRGQYFDYSPENADIRSFFKAQNTIRIGGEARITPQFSVRLGYSYSTSGVDSKVDSNATEVFPSGLQPAYSVDKDTQYITLGAGYRWTNFYVDAAFVNRKNESTWHAYGTYEGNVAPNFDVTRTNNQVVLTLGYRF